MGVVRKSFDEADERREIPNGVVAGVQLAGSKAAKSTFQPGWKWSGSLRPTVGGDSCQKHHIGYVLSGTLCVATPDGQEQELSPVTHTRLPRATTPGSWRPALRGARIRQSDRRDLREDGLNSRSPATREPRNRASAWRSMLPSIRVVHDLEGSSTAASPSTRPLRLTVQGVQRSDLAKSITPSRRQYSAPRFAPCPHRLAGADLRYRAGRADAHQEQAGPVYPYLMLSLIGSMGHVDTVGLSMCW